MKPSIMTRATNTQAYLKAGFLGFQGSGKTYTACLLLIGLIKLLRELGHEDGKRPVAMLDTETGSSWVAHMFEKAGIEFLHARTQSFRDLANELECGEKHYGFLLIDSITHFWLEFTEAFKKMKGKSSLSFQDWDWLKTEWRQRFTNPFLNSKLHIAMCGRAAYTYDLYKDENGRNQAEKTGVKIRGESELGYEPSLVVWMDKEQDLTTKQVYRSAVILKDRRSDERSLDGMTIPNPTFDSFRSHVEHLNILGPHIGIDTSRNSDELISGDIGESTQMLLGDIKGELLMLYPGRSSSEQAQKMEALNRFFGERNWQRIEGMDSGRLADGLAKLREFRQKNTAMTT